MPCDVSRELDDVVDAGRVVAAGREHLDAGVEQLAHRALAPGAQLATSARAHRRIASVVGPRGVRLQGFRELAPLRHCARCGPRGQARRM